MSTSKTSGQWWARVTHDFQTHVREETHFLDEYERLVEETDDPAVTFLLKLILDDERRHHALFEGMTRAAVGESGAMPAPPRPTPAVIDALLGPTERFLDAERHDQARLRELQKELKPVRGETLWPLVVELMVLDTEKHIRILDYLRSCLRSAKD